MNIKKQSYKDFEDSTSDLTVDKIDIAPINIKKKTSKLELDPHIEIPYNIPESIPLVENIYSLEPDFRLG